MADNSQRIVPIGDASAELVQSLDDKEQKAMQDTSDDGNDKAMKKKLQPVTVRFTKDTWDAIHEIADSAHVSMAELIRYAVAGKLEEYLGTIEFVEVEQGEKIRNLIYQLINLIGDVKMELTRIGINFDQQVVLAQIDHELNKPGLPLSRELELINKRKEVLSGVGVLDHDQMEHMMDKYNDAVRKVGDQLCRILASRPRMMD